MRLLALVASCLLAACSTYSEVQSMAPEIVVATAKAPAEYAGCIMPKARERWASYASIAPDGATQVLTIAVEGSRVLATVTIVPEGSGSRVAYRTTTQAGRFRAFTGDVAACV